MKSHYLKMIEYADYNVPNILKRQCLNKESLEYGVLEDGRKGFTEHSSGIGLASTLISLYYNEHSKYFKNELVLDRAIIAANATLNKMHDDGTIDLVETNFHCAATFGFTVWNAGPAYRVIEKFGAVTDKEKELKAIYREYLERGADGMKNGGFHTPNHRWVVASTLAMLSNILDRPDLAQAVDLYTNEGIDCNEDGEFSERSAGVYNVVNNRGLTVMAEELGRWEYLDHVTRNLYMMYTYIEPNDALLTMNSRRQDFGKEIIPILYYENYLMVAHYTKNKHFAHMADYLFNICNQNPKDPSSLSFMRMPKIISLYMLHDFLREDELEKEAFDIEHYEHFYQESKIARYRHEDVTATIVADHDTFLKLQKGSVSVMLRFAASFFGDNGQFISDSIKKIDGGYRLHYHCDWGYVRPLNKPDRPIKNGHTNKEHRVPVQMQIYDVTIDCFPKEDGVDIKIVSDSCENLPCKLEFIYPPDGYFDTKQVQFKAGAGQHALVRDGEYTYTKGNSKFTVTGAFGKTTYHSELRGSNTPIPSAFTVFFTDISPTTREVSIKVK